MTLLLDTHTVLWMTEQVARLGKTARRRCDAALAAGELVVSTVVFYEIGRALQRGRIAGPPTIRDWRLRILSSGVREIPVSAEIALRAADLDNLSGDPLDRIVLATALVEDALLVTADRRILSWPGNVRRFDAQR